MIRIFYLDKDPLYYQDLICWLPDFCSLHELILSDLENESIPLHWENDLLIINPELSGNNREFLIKLIQKVNPVPVIFLSEVVDLPFVSFIIRAGAHSFLNKKEDKSILIETIKNILYDVPDEISETNEDSLSDIVGSSQKIFALKNDIRRLKSSTMHIHLTGETGTGKELAARAIHKYRLGFNKSLLTINCGAISENLIESELFGTKKGAFTDAIERTGVFEEANGSTVLLDEVSELTKQAQVKLLRVLEYGTFNRVGSSKEIKSNFQLITATNSNLKNEVNVGNFREDLYYRITTLIIRIPPLRERIEDLQELSTHFLLKINSSKKLTAESLQKLKDYSWPGNIRELKQVITRADHFAEKKSYIEPKHIVYY